MAEYRFRRTCGYMGCTEYEVVGDGPAYRIQVRNEASDYERSIFNGGDAEWERDVVGAIGLVHRWYGSDRPIPEEVVAAFNAWRQAEHADLLATIRREWKRYGKLPPDDPLTQPPAVVRGARYVVGTGWVVNEPAEVAA